MASPSRAPPGPRALGPGPRSRTGRRWTPGSSKPIEATFGFIDLAGFTALTEEHGDHDAADMAARFAELTRAALGAGDRLIKTIGDAVLVTSPSPGAALDLVDRLLTLAADDKTLPRCAPAFTRARPSSGTGTSSAPPSISPRVSRPRPTRARCS